MNYGVGAAVLCWMAALSYFDIRYRRLPNWLTLAAAVVVVVVAVVGRDLPMAEGAMALTALYLIAHLISPQAMGAGDVKLAFGLGGLSGAFGLDAWFIAAIGAPLLTGLVGLVVMAFGRRGTSVPHGPSMCLATAVAVGLSTASSF
ncbi:prepilin peptidase [Mycobacterium sp. CBMA271]|uniref:prepilin peptidase n=1 Tax=unclassified Mycobacteroides TaxID=2618759 RepID=UPI0012DF27C8|nr:MULTISPECIES: A24 family peptidase [unclassified Mycobacteroides]MUM18448.1 type IV prepilin leader peptidase [Mycobacteroides sp. CBMA 326]MUM23717.1 prepilin peptidase [Mycobacteroides sp. CBMA 271]